MVSVGCGVYPAAHIGNTDLIPAISKNIFKMAAEAPSRLKHLLNLFATAVSVCVCVCVLTSTVPHAGVRDGRDSYNLKH